MNENTYQSFEDLKFWGKSKDLAILIYNTFFELNDYSFKNQIQRAGISVSNNIAEGFERQSNKELKQFLYISKGSCGEVRNMLLIGKELGYIGEENFNKIYNQSLEISKMLSGYIKNIST